MRISLKSAVLHATILVHANEGYGEAPFKVELSRIEEVHAEHPVWIEVAELEGLTLDRLPALGGVGYVEEVVDVHARDKARVLLGVTRAWVLGDNRSDFLVAELSMRRRQLGLRLRLLQRGSVLLKAYLLTGATGWRSWGKIFVFASSANSSLPFARWAFCFALGDRFELLGVDFLPCVPRGTATLLYRCVIKTLSMIRS